MNDPAVSLLPHAHTGDDPVMTNAARVSRSAAGCLLLAAAADLTAVLLFSLRDGVNGGTPPTHAYLVLERGLFMAGMLVSALGFCLLEERPRLVIGLALLRSPARPAAAAA